MPKTNTDVTTPTVSAPRANTANGRRNRRSEPNPLGGNFILMPSLLEYLSPDLTLPEQYFYRQRNDDGMGAEKALMYAVLKDGIRCFYKHVGATRRKYRKMSAEAEEWLMEETWDYPFSFRVICDTLNIDADCLRKKLVTWKDFELERRRVTGDTKSVQVGRSPFPTYEELDAPMAAARAELDAEADIVENGEEFEQVAADASSMTFEQIQPAPLAGTEGEDDIAARATDSSSDDSDDIDIDSESDSNDGWHDVEHVSLEDIKFSELDEVA